MGRGKRPRLPADPLNTVRAPSISVRASVAATAPSRLSRSASTSTSSPMTWISPRNADASPHASPRRDIVRIWRAVNRPIRPTTRAPARMATKFHTQFAARRGLMRPQKPTLPRAPPFPPRRIQPSDGDAGTPCRHGSLSRTSPASQPGIAPACVPFDPRPPRCRNRAYRQSGHGGPPATADQTRRFHEARSGKTGV